MGLGVLGTGKEVGGTAYGMAELTATAAGAESFCQRDPGSQHPSWMEGALTGVGWEKRGGPEP